MNKNIKLAVAGAIFAASASIANAGIVIPAGEWTIDINGNVNSFASYTKVKSGTAAGTGAMAGVPGTGENGNKQIGLDSGLLPSWLGFTGKTRQNDLDVEFTISLQPSSSDNGVHGDGASGTADTKNTVLNRQTYVSFGDKSWGSIKLGKDLGVFAADAILNDMTLLGVGQGAGISGKTTNTSNGGIGTGYIYAAWKSQIAYTTPNFNGFQATVALTNPDQGFNVSGVNQDRFGLEGKASYAFNANDITGKVWVSGASYDRSTSATASHTVTVGDIGGTVNANGFGLTGYYYSGKGAGTTVLGANGYDATYGRRDSDGGYVQLTYVTPIKTKLGIAYGESNLDKGSAADTAIVKSNQRITVGAYHPLTKHLNIVAEYNNVEAEGHNGGNAESNTYSAGAIMFF
jgi:predicted porin